MISKKFVTRAAGQVEATVACHSAKTTTTAVLNHSTTVRAARIKAEDILIGARREVDTVNKITTTATRVTGADTLHLQEGGRHLHPVLQASAPACRPHLRWPNTTVTVVVVMVEAINRATATVVDTVPRLHLPTVADSTRVEAEALMGEAIKGKGIGSHHHRAAMIVGTEVEEAAVMAVIGDTIGDMATTKGVVTAVATVVELSQLSVLIP